MIRFKHITVVGVGLIGGSFALSARRVGLAERLTGWDAGRSLDAAVSSGVIDAVETAFDEGRISDADLVYLAAPIDGIIDFIRDRGHLLKKGAIVTDAGSAKREICRAASQSLTDSVHFVGGHPMAGSHHSGFEFASAHLFADAPYVITVTENPEDDQPDRVEAVRNITEIARRVGARPVLMTAEKHDYIVARVSHAPQIVSTALALAVTSQREESLRVAGSGFRDMTRLARSDWGVWEGICRANADELVRAIDEILITIQSLRDSAQAEEWGKLQSAFQKAGEFSQALERERADKS